MTTMNRPIKSSHVCVEIVRATTATERTSGQKSIALGTAPQCSSAVAPSPGETTVSRPFEFRRHEWQEKALCRGRTKEFFAQQLTKAQIKVLTDICEQCPVQTECLDLALSFEIDNDGVFGGTTPRQRQAIRNHRIRANTGETA
jgi:hypothetical protein